MDKLKKPSTRSKVIKIENLSIGLHRKDKSLSLIKDLNLALIEGKTLGLVGESGSGKTLTGLSMMGLLDKYGPKVDQGSIHYCDQLENDRDLLNLTENQFDRLRGKEIAMIFQEPMTSLNPLFTVGQQIQESVIKHEKKSVKIAKERAIKALREVEIPSPEKMIKTYPYQLSGGMRQRVMIAMALVCHPKVLIADEPTTALDVTIQAQILQLMKRLQKENNMSVLFITHNLGVVAEVSDNIAVMYSGQIVEQGTVKEVFAHPRHPYTLGLLACLPKGARDGSSTRVPLQAIPGVVPPPDKRPKGCVFAPRCSYSKPDCSLSAPPLLSIGKTHFSRCVYWEKI